MVDHRAHQKGEQITMAFGDHNHQPGDELTLNLASSDSGDVHHVPVRVISSRSLDGEGSLHEVIFEVLADSTTGDPPQEESSVLSR